MRTYFLKKIQQSNKNFNLRYPAPSVRLSSIVMNNLQLFIISNLNALIKMVVFLSCVLSCLILYSMNTRLEADFYAEIPQPLVEETLLQVDPSECSSWTHSIIKWTAYGIWGYGFVQIAPVTILIGGCGQLCIMFIPDIITTVVPTNIITVVPTVTTIIPVVVVPVVSDWSSIFAHHLLESAHWRSALGPVVWNEWGLWRNCRWMAFQGFGDSFERLTDCYIICRWCPSLFLDPNIITILIRLNDLLIDFWPATVTRSYFPVVEDQLMRSYAVTLSGLVNALADLVRPTCRLADIRNWVWFM